MKSIEEAYKRIKHNKGTLSSIFMMTTPKEKEKDSWQFDFYDKNTDSITSYKDEEEINTEEKIFKEEETNIKELNLKQVKITAEEATRKAEEAIEQYHESISKYIIVLQQFESPTWNITLVTTTFNILNIKIDAITGEVKDQNHSSLLSFKE